MNAEWFFVYGTLKCGQCREMCWPATPLQVQTGFVRGSLIDLVDYPGLLPGEDWVRGEIWQIAAPQVTETLRVLDAIEGYQVAGGSDNLYDRRRVEVYRAMEDRQPTVTAYTYWYVAPHPHSATLVPRSPQRDYLEWPTGETS
ncbi:gamma-glutamylcyclotransferase family protein [Roseimaritima ulvae]|uniref:Gamma-L-glutamyl-butirosin B gamma-glutamyl cyclotransferase n=1 Tax=Roseimaritima ulvae TaxID=980254 RepID=A0A5B9QSJ5_9BACT|nr:gamma-glutamylcyclotransferase family protein [Roseimaritima ulvae]QEG40700.1 Gamma-L-glutamyl-butirosin B gamma-glutamyl cyclotransferase [Roseimaritima ulvae]